MEGGGGGGEKKPTLPQNYIQPAAKLCDWVCAVELTRVGAPHERLVAVFRRRISIFFLVFVQVLRMDKTQKLLPTEPSVDFRVCVATKNSNKLAKMVYFSSIFTLSRHLLNVCN